jgi:hypothetical protein
MSSKQVGFSHVRTNKGWDTLRTSANRVDLVQENATTTLANYDYDARGRRDFLTRGNGATSDWSYDAASRLTGLAHDLPGGTADDQTSGFSYTPASQISQRTAANENYNWTAPTINREIR